MARERSPCGIWSLLFTAGNKSTTNESTYSAKMKATTHSIIAAVSLVRLLFPRTLYAIASANSTKMKNTLTRKLMKMILCSLYSTPRRRYSRHMNRALSRYPPLTLVNAIYVSNVRMLAIGVMRMDQTYMNIIRNPPWRRECFRVSKWARRISPAAPTMENNIASKERVLSYTPLFGTRRYLCRSQRSEMNASTKNTDDTVHPATNSGLRPCAATSDIYLWNQSQYNATNCCYFSGTIRYRLAWFHWRICGGSINLPPHQEHYQCRYPSWSAGFFLCFWGQACHT